MAHDLIRMATFELSIKASTKLGHNFNVQDTEISIRVKKMSLRGRK